jgi:deoxyribodipyrimidine photo-lyase
MSSNVYWQAAGTGCDATPYFRVFNPSIQLKKFDEKGIYIRQWILNLNSRKAYGRSCLQEKELSTYA